MVSTGRINRIATSRRRALWAGAMAIGAVALYGRLVSPHMGYLQAMQQLEGVVGEMAEETDRIHTGLGKKCRRLQTVRQDWHTAHECLFTGEESRALLRDLHCQVEEVGCTLIMADLAPEEEVEQVGLSAEVPRAAKVIHALLTVKGQYDQIVTMLARLRDDRRRIWVDTLHLDLYDSAGGRFECQLALTICASAGGEKHK